jgi:hypothetical protein
MEQAFTKLWREVEALKRPEPELMHPTTEIPVPASSVLKTMMLTTEQVPPDPDPPPDSRQPKPDLKQPPPDPRHISPNPDAEAVGETLEKHVSQFHHHQNSIIMANLTHALPIRVRKRRPAQQEQKGAIVAKQEIIPLD